MKHLIKINLPGGFSSAGDLYEILFIAESAGASTIRFGNRQQLYFEIAANRLEDMELDMLKSEIAYEIDADENPNIISSYVTDSIFNHHESWLREGVYKDIFDAFDYQPKLKVNLVDSNQTLVSFFSGNINFIASGTNNYWFTYVRFPKTEQVYCLPSLVYSEDIPVLTQAIENTILGRKGSFSACADINEEAFQKALTKNIGLAFRPIVEPLKLPDFYLPYYEGFNKYGNKYWLGIYRRNELFPLEFLKDACLLCLKTRIGQVYTTPWKSIIIKGIEQADRVQWGLILSKYQLNIRHAANELNWQIEDICAEGLELKQQLVRQFEEADLRTYQLCFAIKTQAKTGLQGSVVIRKNNSGTYDILHTQDFNPNSKEKIVFAQGIKPSQLSKKLIALCAKFYSQQADPQLSVSSLLQEQPSSVADEVAIYECSSCFSRYDKSFGDIVNGIEKGTDFELLTEYECPVCGGPKSDFQLVTSAVNVY